MKNKKPTGLENLASTLPPLVARRRIGDYLPGIISAGYLANLDSQGLGPRRSKIGAKVVYRREDLIAWLENKIIHDTQDNMTTEVD